MIQELQGLKRLCHPQTEMGPRAWSPGTGRYLAPGREQMKLLIPDILQLLVL